MVSLVEQEHFVRKNFAVVGIQLTRCLLEQIPLELNNTKLTTTLLLSGLAELGDRTDGLQTVVFGPSGSNEQLLIHQNWPLASPVQMLASDYDSCIHAIFSEHLPLLISVISREPLKYEVDWRRLDDQLRTNDVEQLAALLESCEESGRHADYHSQLVECGPGTIITLDHHEYLRRAVFKKLSAQMRQTARRERVVLKSGWSCGQIALLPLSPLNSAGQALHLYRFPVLSSDSADQLMKYLQDCYNRVAAAHPFLAEVKKVTVSSRIASLGLAFAKRIDKIVILPDLVYGWNPQATLIEVIAQKQNAIALLMPHMSFVDFVVVEND